MQHTEALNLKLIEPDDTFSPDPLNENAQTLETALTAETDARSSADTALDARLKVFEAKHLKVGMYTARAEYAPITISLGFTPKAVFAFSPNGIFFGALYEGYTSPTAAEIIPGGFRIKSVANSSGGMGCTTTYIYLAVD